MEKQGMEQHDLELLKEMRILYVEDEEEIRESLSLFLKRRAKEVYIAKNGKEGLALFFETNPDMVITDINMPVMNGLEMARQIKEKEPKTQIIVTTAHSEENLFLASIDIGVSSYVIKPVVRDKLLTALMRCANVVKLEKEVMLRSRQVQQLLDFQDAIVFITNGNSVSFCNRRFLEFFGYKTLELFSQEHACVCDFFLLEEGYVYQKEGSNWLNHILSRGHKEHKVKIHDQKKQIDRIFVIKMSQSMEDQNSYVVSLTDITQFELQKEELEEIALKDELTGIYNRKKFNSYLEIETKKISRTGGKMSLIMFDIDHFKNINDTYGHLVGDKVLINLTRVVTEHIRSVDVFARWGGEEFVVLAVGSDMEGAWYLAEKLRSIIEITEMAEGIFITCSFGVAQMQEDDSVISLQHRSDEALYVAKNNGRNRVERALTT